MRLPSVEVLREVALTAIVSGLCLYSVSVAATLAPLTTFGGGDGWRAPREALTGDTPGTDALMPGLYDYLGSNAQPNNSANLERGLAYNPTTGNLILVSRSNAGNGIRILDGQTGVDKGFLNQGPGIIAGGLFTTNMVGIADDGAIYVTNLATDTDASTFKIYRWESESSVEPSVAYEGGGASANPPTLATARLGDTFDVIGSGASTRLVAGYGATAATGDNSFALFTTSNGLEFAGTHVTIASSPPADGDFRLGITFTDSDTVIGKQSTLAHVVDIDGSTGTLAASFDTDGASLRPMDFAIVDGRPILAIMEASGDNTSLTARARLFIYDLTDTSAPLAERKIQEGSNFPIGVIQDANGNGTGQVKFGPINGNVATIYAMSTNNGIQAFQLTLDSVVSDNADFDGDSDVDGNDFLIWQRNFGAGTTQPNGDANNDGSVTVEDLDVWKTQFGAPSAGNSISAVPEPTAGIMCVLAATALLHRRRLR